MDPVALARLRACDRRPWSFLDLGDEEVLEQQRTVEELKRNMLTAVRSNSIESIRSYISLGAPLDDFYLGRRLLHQAIAANHMDVVRILLQFGVNPHLLDDGKSSALQLAVIMNNSSIVRMLLEARANVHYISRFNYNKRTILHEAAMRGNREIIRLLIDYGANLQGVDNRGVDVLGYAAAGYPNQRWNNQADRDDLLKILISRGARVLPDGPEGKNEPFHAFLRHGTLQGLQLLLDNGIEIELSHFRNKLLLHSAAQNIQHQDVFKHLIDTGIFDINEKDSDGNTPLHIAILKNSNSCVKLLLRNGANPNIANASNQTPLHNAVITDNLFTVELLLEYDAHLYFTSTGCSMLGLADGLAVRELRENNGLIARYHVIVHELIKYIALLESKGHEVEPSDLKLIKKYPKEFQYFESCRGELGILREHIHAHVPFTFHDILTGRALYRCADNHYILSVFQEPWKIRDKFPIYGQQVLSRFKRLQERLMFTHKALNGLNNLLPFETNDFPLVAYKILDSLQIDHLVNLSKV
ncbi:hypothetical protein QAD02_019532 [Eretmocerus hayati]|uniref:Uncharacterized protein n=1 Tax=Eretmocerus hayati TaxID=131215 RepID=A0ACC2PJH6_9HYME|nr:hypothetical protein QAD02_019532 [Eretmocerus hayati]